MKKIEIIQVTINEIMLLKKAVFRSKVFFKRAFQKRSKDFWGFQLQRKSRFVASGVNKDKGS